MVLPPVDFIDKINFYGYEFSKNKALPFTLDSNLTYTDSHQYLLELNTMSKESIQYLFKKKAKFDLYIEISFKNTLLDLEGFKQYDYDSNWFIPVEITDHRVRSRHGRNIIMKNDGYKIIRHPKHGEVPDFELRERSFSQHYKTST